ncbi:phosphoribosyltransferase [Patescibacteria group bacterium]
MRKKLPSLKIITDKTNGLITMDLVERVGENRKYKIKNNFTGILAKSDVKKFEKICKLLNKELPAPVKDEVVVGMVESGVVMACMLAKVRNTRFTYSTKREYRSDTTPIKILEKRVNNRVHHFYDLNPKDKVIIIEDEVSKGDGLCLAWETFRTHGIEVLALCSIIETLNYHARENIKKRTGLNLVSLVEIELNFDF